MTAFILWVGGAIVAGAVLLLGLAWWALADTAREVDREHDAEYQRWLDGE